MQAGRPMDIFDQKITHISCELVDLGNQKLIGVPTTPKRPMFYYSGQYTVIHTWSNQPKPVKIIQFLTY